MTIALIIEFILIFIIYLISKEKYTKEISVLNEKEYSIKQLLPLGLFVIDILNYPFSGKYQANLYQNILKIYGTRYAKYYLRIHWAEKVVYSFIGLLISTFICLAAEVGDVYILFIPVSAAGLFFLSDKTLKDKAKQRKIQIQLDFPIYLNTIILLINAGMTVKQAFEKLVTENKKDTPLYKEFCTVLEDMWEGKTELQAYEDLAERCKVREISSFVGILVQNLRIGGAHLTHELKTLADDCWNLRKRTAKQLGEEASTKLIFPIMLMFIAVLIVVIMPVIMSFQGI